MDSEEEVSSLLSYARQKRLAHAATMKDMEWTAHTLFTIKVAQVHHEQTRRQSLPCNG